MCPRRGKEAAHVKSSDKPEMNEVHFDFFFMGKEGEPGRTIPTATPKSENRGC